MGGPLASLGLNPDQIDAIVRALTEKERARPGILRPPEHRRVAERANALMMTASGSRDVGVSNRVAASDVASAIQHAAMLAVTRAGVVTVHTATQGQPGVTSGAGRCGGATPSSSLARFLPRL